MTSTDRTDTPGSGTEYVVLRYDLSGSLPCWVQLPGTVRARSAHDAIRASTPHPADHGPGVFVAVPVRSFQPVNVTVETTTRIVLEDA